MRPRHVCSLKSGLKWTLRYCRDISRQGTETVIAKTNFRNKKQRQLLSLWKEELKSLKWTECCSDEIQKRNETLETGENKPKQHTPVFYDYSCLWNLYVSWILSLKKLEYAWQISVANCLRNLNWATWYDHMNLPSALQKSARGVIFPENWLPENTVAR